MAIIRLSGYPGAGKTTVSSWLAKELGYGYHYNGGTLREMAKERKMSIEDFYREIANDEKLERELDKKSEELMLSTDNIIVEGRVAPFQKSGFKAINILLTVSPDEGARRQALRPENKGKSVEAIATLTIERIKNEREHYRNLYGIEDHFNPEHFDIVLDTTNLKTEDACQMVFERVKEKINE